MGWSGVIVKASIRQGVPMVWKGREEPFLGFWGPLRCFVGPSTSSIYQCLLILILAYSQPSSRLSKLNTSN